MQTTLSAFHDRGLTALASGHEEDRDAYDREVREAISAFRPKDEVDRCFDVFRPTSDWDGMRLFIERAARA